MKINREIEVAVIGAGVVGLAVARLLASSGKKVFVFEKASAVGTETSARGSHVVHSGIYYSPGSLKAKLCVKGRKMLYKYCKERNINFRKIGKIIVATSPKEVATLEKLKTRAERNGIIDLKWLTPQQVEKMELEVRCSRGLFSPSTGIIDGVGFMNSLLKEAKNYGVTIELATSIKEGVATDNGVILAIDNGRRTEKILCHSVINAAGLWAPNVAKSIAGIRLENIPKSYFAKGHYFKLKGPSPFTHLIYPVPVKDGLGIHSTLNLKGEVLFGPDVSWVEKVDYHFETGKEKAFYRAIRKYYPTLKNGVLEPDHTGIRPKITPVGSPAQDFIIQGEKEHGVKGLINLFGIESPGFTSSLAIAEEVEKRISE